jgi:GT2 family glycosyltransferase
VSGATVVIPTHGDADSLRRLLEALNAQAGTTRLPVVVVDDCSEPPLELDPLTAYLQQLDVRVVRADSNRGPGGARNLGLAEVATRWVAFLDADMLPGPGWVERLRAIVRQDAVDGVEGRVEVSEGTRATPFTHTTEFLTPGSHHGAGNVAFRTESIREAGGFDERFFDARRGLHFREDTELHFRLLEEGRTVSYDPELVARHTLHDASFLTPVRLTRRYFFDALLAREHPNRFRELIRSRAVGPFSLRLMRHLAAIGFPAGLVLTACGVALSSRPLLFIGLGIAVAAWVGTAVGVAWKRAVRIGDVPRLAAVALLVPWVYAFHFYRGVARFRHHPRF